MQTRIIRMAPIIPLDARVVHLLLPIKGGAKALGLYCLVLEAIGQGESAEIPRADLARLMGISVSTLDRTAKLLESTGLAERSPTFTDERGQGHNAWRL